MPPPSWEAPDFVNTISAEAFAIVATSGDWEYVASIDDTIIIFRSKSLSTLRHRGGAQ
jgi:hypothetical protein